MKNDMDRFSYAMERLRYCVDRLSITEDSAAREATRKVAADYAVIALALRD